MQSSELRKFASARPHKFSFGANKLLIGLATILALCVAASSAQQQDVGFFSWLGGIWRGELPPKSEGFDEDWNDDACDFQAVAGRLFNQSLKEVFARRDLAVAPEDEIKIQIRTAETEQWLFREGASLLGVPLSRDEAHEHHLVATLFQGGEVALTVPCTVHVTSNEKSPRPKKVAWTPGEGPVQCLSTEPVVTLAISLQPSADDITSTRRVRLIQDLSAFMARPQVINALTVTMETQPAQGNVAFMSGRGNAAARTPRGRDPVRLAWPVGCGGDAFQLPTLDRVEKSAASGELSTALGYDVVEWKVENRKPAAVKIVSLNQLRKERDSIASRQTENSKKGRLRLKRQAESSPGIFTALTPSTPPPDDADMARPRERGKNTNPTVQAGVPDLRVPRCNYFEYRVPREAFNDAEDGDTRALRLTLVDRAALNVFAGKFGNETWMLLDAATQTLYGVPPRTTTSDELQFMLMAEDRSGESVVEDFTVNVAPKPRPANHRFTIYLSFYDGAIVEESVPSAFARTLTRALGAGFSDLAPPGRYTILKSEGNGQELTVSWFKNDLGNRKKCDRDALERLWNTMTGNQLTYDLTQRSKVTNEFRRAFAPQFGLKSAKLTLYGPCDMPEPSTEKPSVVTMSPPLITPPPPKITTPKTTVSSTTASTVSSTKKTLPSPPPITPKPMPKSTASTTKPTTTTTSKPPPATTTTTPMPKTEPKLIRKPELLDNSFELIIPASVGKETRVKIPETKFFIPSRDSVRFELQPWGDELPLWVAVDRQATSLVALPSLDDVMALDEANATHRVWNGGLAAVSTVDGSKSDRLRVKVYVEVPPMGEESQKKVNHVFVARIENYVLENFTSVDSSKFLRLIGSVLGDTRDVFVLSLRAGSVIISWYNTSLASDAHCPRDQINSLGQQLDSELKSLQERLNTAGFAVSLIELRKKNACADPPPTPKAAPTTTTPMYTSTPTHTPGLEVAGGDGATSIIIIAVVLVCILVLVAVAVFKCRASGAARRKRDDKKRLQSAAATAAVMTPNSPFHLQGNDKNGGAFGDATLHFKPGTPIVLAGETGGDGAGTPLLQRTSTFTQGHNGRAEAEAIPLNHMGHGDAEPVRPPPPAYAHK